MDVIILKVIRKKGEFMKERLLENLDRRGGGAQS